MRDPRLESGELKYDWLVCISARPDALVYWGIGAADVGQLMDDGQLVIQHAMSNTKWFFPARSADDAFAPFRRDFAGLQEWARGLL